MLRAWVLVLATVLLTACATTGGKEELKQAQSLSATGQLTEAHEVLQRAAVKYPGDAEVQAGLKALRQRLGNFLAAQASEAMEKQRWDDAERQYKQLAAVPGYEQQSASGLTQLAERRASVPAVVLPKVTATVVPATPTPGGGAVRSYEGFDVAVGGKAITTRPATNPAAGLAQSPVSDLEQALERRVTLQFRDASVRSLFDVIGKTSGLNIVFDRDVSPDLKTTVFLKNTTVRAAIDKIVLTSQLAWRALDEDTLLIYNDDVTKQRDYQALTVRSFVLANADAKLVANSLKTVLRFNNVVVDPKLNMIVMRDTPEAIRLAEKLVAMHDVPEAEVMLEIEVIEISRSMLQNLGIEWPTSLSLTPLPSGNYVTADGSATLTLKDLMTINSSRIGAAIGPVTAKAGKSDGDLNLLANPRIRIRNRDKAKVLIGERVPNINSTATSTGFVSENITYVDVGLKLEAEPQIFADREVAIKLNLEVSQISETVQTKSGTQAYRITTRNAATVLRLKDGENQVLAGLIQDIDRKQAQKVPGLGDIPVLGYLFGSHSDDQRKTEIVLSITPRLIRAINKPTPDAAGFDAGTVTSVRGRRPDNELQGGNAGFTDGMQQGTTTTTTTPTDSSRRRERDED